MPGNKTGKLLQVPLGESSFQHGLNGRSQRIHRGQLLAMAEHGDRGIQGMTTIQQCIALRWDWQSHSGRLRPYSEQRPLLLTRDGFNAAQLRNRSAVEYNRGGLPQQFPRRRPDLCLCD